MVSPFRGKGISSGSTDRRATKKCPSIASFIFRKSNFQKGKGDEIWICACLFGHPGAKGRWTCPLLREADIRAVRIDSVALRAARDVFKPPNYSPALIKLLTTLARRAKPKPSYWTASKGSIKA